MAVPSALTKPRQPGQRAQFADAEAAAPAKFSGRRRHAGAQCLGRGKQAVRLRHQALAGFGQHHAAMPGAVEERLPERSFQFSNPFRAVEREIDALRSRREVAAGCGRPVKLKLLRSCLAVGTFKRGGHGEQGKKQGEKL